MAMTVDQLIKDLESLVKDTDGVDKNSNVRVVADTAGSQAMDIIDATPRDDGAQQAGYKHVALRVDTGQHT